MSSKYENGHAARIGPWKVRIAGIAEPQVYNLGAEPRIHPFALGCVTCGLAVASVQASEVVYDNLTSPLNLYLGGFGAYEEVADDVTLASGARIFDSATVAYTGSGFSGDETLTFTLYAMDGAPTPDSFGFNTPGTVLFTSTAPIVEGSANTIAFSDNSGTVVLPDNVGVGLIFSGIDFDPATSDGGGLLFDPPSVGTSFDDFWLRGFPNPGDPWGLFTFGGNPPVNLGFQISANAAIPEPGTWISMGGLALLVGSVFARRFRKSN